MADEPTAGPEFNQAVADQALADAVADAGRYVEGYRKLRDKSGERFAMTGLVGKLVELDPTVLVHMLAGAVHRLAVPEPEMPTLDASSPDPAATAPRVKGNYIGSPACLLLDQAVMPIHAAFPDAVGIIQVGSSLERADWRDIDVRLILDDADFERMFGPAAQMGRVNAMWSLFCASVSRHLSAVTGLPIDFQVQPMLRATALHGGGLREPLGVFVPALRADEPDTPEGVDHA